MSRKEDKARLAGMEYAYRQIKEHGLEYFEKELKNRGAWNISIPITNADIETASRAIREQTFDTMLCMSLLTLRDEFDFGKQRLERFLGRFEEKSHALEGGELLWEDYCQVIKDECGIDLKIRYNEATD